MNDTKKAKKRKNLYFFVRRGFFKTYIIEVLVKRSDSWHQNIVREKWITIGES